CPACPFACFSLSQPAIDPARHTARIARNRFGTRRMANTPDSNSMWGGRFGGGPAAIMQEINASIPVDKRLWEEDIAASRAHAAILGATGIIAVADATVIDQGLAQIAEKFAANGVPVDLALEDIHMTVESRLKE